ncbi:cation:proton antiporter [Entomobacter blattae]|uniref:Sodium/hydrogen exchanger family protein n=1 Tax=Entomobacter blattae TaxID=2762277 RepID=A0A7H1NSR1_9PROT|nr:cation:proton antiporter [Entomobacter blattae]QNT78821.1 Sodium/hydrogen exchanger family protein [Entomobacter blattae]
MYITGLAAVLLATAVLLVIVSTVQPLARRLELSETVLLAVVGISIGAVADFAVRMPHSHMMDSLIEILLDFPMSSEAFLFIFLPILVFQGALAIDVRRLVRETATVLLLAVVAVIVSTATIGLALYPFSNVPLVVCLLVGSIVATTDPSAVAGIFREIGAASRLLRLVEGEALFNDAAAIAIFSVFLTAIMSHRDIHVGEAFLDFLISFGGAVIVGIILARLTLMFIVSLGAAPAAEVTLTVALPYLSYIVCDEIFRFSGVVATAVAGLTISVYGPSTFHPQTWRFLQQLWQQLVFWAGSLVFIMASMLIPRLLIGMTRWDFVLILIASAAGLLARGFVVFAMLPLLSVLRLSPPVPFPFKMTMAWGGLRGAITLALALAVTENEQVSTPIAHYVGIIATGFVLITLLVNGTTLRAMVVFFKLDQLPPIDQALRHQIIGIGLGEVRDRTRRLAGELRFSAQTTNTVIETLNERIEEEQEVNNFDTALGDRQRVILSLITIASQERSILLDLFRMRGLPRRVMELLLRGADSMIEAARLEGRFGYLRAQRRRLRPTLAFRFGQFVHNHFRIDYFLALGLIERFETLIIAHLVSQSLDRFIRRRIEPTLGPRITEIVTEVQDRQSKQLSDAMGTIRLHYSGYMEALEVRILRLLSLRAEGEEYDELLAESLISEELHSELFKDVERRENRFGKRLRLNIKSGIERQVCSLPAFRNVSEAVLQHLVTVFSIHFFSPQEEVYRRGKKIKYIYFISSGLMDAHIAEHDVHFSSGDVLGAEEVMEGELRARATIRAVEFGHTLVLSRRAFIKILQDYPVIATNIRTIIKSKKSLLAPQEFLLLPPPSQS